MNSRNNIQKQYSENNNAAFGHYAVLLGTFLGFVAIYASFFKKEIMEHSTAELFLWFSTITLMIVLSLLAILAVNIGYARRRDHVVTCVREVGQYYPEICGNGRSKCIFNFLIGAYNVFFWFFFWILPAFTAFSAILFSRMNYCGKYYIIAVGLVLWIIDFLVLKCHYCEYKRICDKAKTKERLTNTSDSEQCSSKNVTFNISC